MKRKGKVILTMLIFMLLFTVNTPTASATTVSSVTNKEPILTVLTKGYTEDGIPYVVYIKNNLSDNSISPNTLLSKTVYVRIQYDGKIVPPSTFWYSSQEGSLLWQGTLTMTQTWQEKAIVSGWHTYADYSGLAYTSF